MKIDKIIFASHNKGKIEEISQLLAPLGIKVFSSLDMSLPDVEETGSTFEANAILKAVETAKQTGIPSLADDSGLCVTALNGRPGVYSARYAPQRDFAKGMDKLLEELAHQDTDDRSAYFACVLVLAFPDGKYESFEGRVEGNIALAQRGNGGFGYDPIFIPQGYDVTFAQMDAQQKNQISHRGKALQKFILSLKSR